MECPKLVWNWSGTGLELASETSTVKMNIGKMRYSNGVDLTVAAVPGDL